MKLKILTVAAAVLASAPAFAQSRSLGVGIGTGIASSRAASASSSRSSSSLRSTNAATNAAAINSYSTTAGQAPAVFAPGLAAAGIESCNGSVSLGGAAVGGGGALGFPWQDGPCNKRLNARTLWAFGQKEAALQTLCLDDELASAMVSAGVRCRVGRYAPSPEAPAVVAINNAAPADYYNRKGQRFVRVACGSKGATRSADPGVCVRTASN